MRNPLRRFLSGQLRLNAFSGAVGTIVAGCTVLLSYPIYLHYLGYEKLGVWVAMTTVLSIAQLANLGVGSAVTKLVAEEFGRDDRQGVRRYVAMATQLLFGSGLLVFLAILLLRNQLVGAFLLKGDDAALALRILPYVGLITIYYFLIDIAVSVLTGLGRMDLGTYARAGGRLLDLGLSIALLAWGRGIFSLLISDAVALAAVHIACIAMARAVTGFNPFAIFGWDHERFAHLIRFGSGVFGNAVLSVLIAPLNKVVLSRYVGVQSLPVYDIALNGAGMIRSVAEAPLRAIMPEISRIWATRSAQAALRVRHIYNRSMRAIAGLGLPMYVIAFLCDKPMLRLWLRHRYTDAVPAVLNILLFATMVNMLSIPAYYTLMGAGRIRTCFVAHGMASITNVLWLVGLASLARISLNSVAWGSVVFQVVIGAYLFWRAHEMIRKMVWDSAGDSPPSSTAADIAIAGP